MLPHGCTWRPATIAIRRRSMSLHRRKSRAVVTSVIIRLKRKSPSRTSNPRHPTLLNPARFVRRWLVPLALSGTSLRPKSFHSKMGGPLSGLTSPSRNCGWRLLPRADRRTSPEPRFNQRTCARSSTRLDATDGLFSETADSIFRRVASAPYVLPRGSAFGLGSDQLGSRAPCAVGLLFGSHDWRPHWTALGYALRCQSPASNNATIQYE